MELYPIPLSPTYIPWLNMPGPCPCSTSWTILLGQVSHRKVHWTDLSILSNNCINAKILEALPVIFQLCIFDSPLQHPQGKVSPSNQQHCFFSGGVYVAAMPLTGRELALRRTLGVISLSESPCWTLRPLRDSSSLAIMMKASCTFWLS